ncbi:MAG: HAMP domain-containing histidine kinase [Thaumarchaeota archaeon]|nr:HAMP domain-containing histidine kinase [Nitrososphaerota archaeon]
MTSSEGWIIYSSHPHKGFLKEITESTALQNFIQSTDNSITIFQQTDEGELALFSVVKQQGFLQYSGDDWILLFDIPSSILFAEQIQVQNNFIILAGIILSLAITASFVLARHISSPIKLLENKISNVIKSNYEIDVNTSGSEEIESMSKSVQKMVNEIKKSNKQKEEYATMIAHELKTPLTPIQGYADLLLSEKSGELNEKQKKQIKLIKDNAITLNRLISDFTDAQKLELKVLKLNKTKIHLADAIKDSIVNLRQEIEKCNITLTTSLEEQITCVCDKQRITQVLNNLLTNSMDFCPKSNGKINISLQSLGKNAEIIVEDNGIGMSEEQANKVGTKFYQADSSMTREHGGTGLGFAIIYGIVEGHGGTVKIESKIGKGTKVHIILPKKSSTTQDTKIIHDDFEMYETKN